MPLYLPSKSSSEEKWKNERCSKVEAGAVRVVAEGPTWGGAVKDSILEEVMFELQDLRNNTLRRPMMLLPRDSPFPIIRVNPGLNLYLSPPCISL